MPEAVKDPYQVLNLEPGSSDEEVKKQYRRLARVYHPDRNPGDAAWCAEQLTELNIAFDVLSNPARKAALDTKAQAARAAGFQPHARPEPSSHGATGRSTSAPGPPPGPAPAQSTEKPKWSDAAYSAGASSPPPQVPIPKVRRKRSSNGAWIVLAAITGVAGVVGWNKYAPVPPTPSKVIAPGTYTAARPAGSGVPAANSHAAYATPSRAHETAKTHTARVERKHSAREASSAHHVTAVRIPRHFRSLSSSGKSSVALRLAEAAEARGRASMAPRLRNKGINAHGLNYSQMRKLDSQ